MKINLTILNKLAEEKLITLKEHPQGNLFIANYTAAVQYEKLWTPVLKKCRGLIIDSQSKIQAHGFGKFFNWEEHTADELPNEPFSVFEKMDGSLGILYWKDGEPFIATRGSFTSEQALFATQLLKEKYTDSISKLRPNTTYLFEIIYPENRIVVDYGGKEELVLLARVDNDSGAELPLEEIGFPVVESIKGVTDFLSLKTLDFPNKEGFVIQYESGFRIKVKFEEYVRLHRILTRITTKSIWESLRAGDDFQELISIAPDEIYDWLNQQKTQLEYAFEKIEIEARQAYAEINKSLGDPKDRKAFAAQAAKHEYRSLLFNLKDGKSLEEKIWKMIEPEYEKPFFEGKRFENKK